MTLPLYSVEYKRQDGTTPDGRPASMIDADYPPVKVVHCRPSQALNIKLLGTILAAASLSRRDENKDELIHGVITIDPDLGQWRMLVPDARAPRISPDGKLLASSSVDSQSPQIVSLQSTQIPLVIAKKSIGTPSWMPGATELVVNVHSPAHREYQGEEYWGEECETWRITSRGDKLAKISLPSRHDVEDISPDGQWVAMHWDTHASVTGSQLFVARLDGNDLRPVARKRRQYYWYPRFSPDGKTVLAKHLSATGEGPWISARVIALDGSHERSISVGDDFHVEYACWSPDGQCIAIVAYDEKQFPLQTSKLFIVDGSGTQIREVKLRNAEGLHLGVIDWTAARINSQ